MLYVSWNSGVIDKGILVKLAEIPPHKIYRMMDRLAKKEEDARRLVLQSTLNLFDQKVDVLFFDVTTLYFESIEADDLRAFGFSKDCKFKDCAHLKEPHCAVKNALLTGHIHPKRYEHYQMMIKNE